MKVPKFFALALMTTGNRPGNILEIGFEILSENLDSIVQWASLVIQPTYDLTGLLDPEIMKTYLASELLVTRDRKIVVGRSPCSLGPIEHVLIKALRTFPNTPILLGTNTHIIRRFLRLHFPGVNALLGDTDLDTESLKLTFPHIEWPKEIHTRAGDSVRSCVEIVLHARRVMNGS